MAKDPVCGMQVDEKEAGKKSLISLKGKKKYYFCSLSCKEKFENKTPWYKSEKFGKLFPYVLATILILGTILSITFNFMILYMGIFFIIFSLFKILDWRGFVNAFSMYDLIAKNVKAYAWAYPAIEFVIGLLFIFQIYVTGAAWVTLFIMIVGGVGVGIKISKKEKFQCACLGTKLNVPLTKVTLLENVLMAIMAVMLLLGFF